MNCIHCKTELVPHEGGGAKRGALHCYNCGCCFVSDGKTPREGMPVCELAQAPAVEAAPVAPEPVEAPTQAPARTTRRRS